MSAPAGPPAKDRVPETAPGPEAPLPVHAADADADAGGDGNGAGGAGGAAPTATGTGIVHEPDRPPSSGHGASADGPAGAGLATGSTPVPLDVPGETWIVEAGKVDVFAVGATADGPRGAREYVLSARAGDALLGMEAHGDLTLVAVGLPTSRLRRMPPGTPVTAGGGMADPWVDALATATARGGRPPADAVLSEGDRWEGPAGRTLSGAPGTTWVRVDEGAVAFGGRAAVRLEAGALLPLGGDAWLRTLGPTTLSAVEAAEVDREERAPAALATLHRSVLEWLADQAEERRREEAERLRSRAEADRTAHRRALSRLAGIIARGDAAGEPVPRGDTFERALAAVGRAAGVELEAGRADAAGVADRIEAAARASGVGYRKVVLHGRWWEKDVGPLLAFRTVLDEGGEEGVSPVALLPAGATRYEIQDPDTGRRQTVDRALATSLEPFAYAFYRPLPSRELSAGDLWRFLGFGLRRDLTTLVLTGVGAAILGLAPPVATGLVFDWVIPSADGVQLLHVFLGLLAIAVCVAAFGVTRSFAVLRIQNRVSPALQLGVVDRLIRLPLPFFRRYTAGDLADRANAVNAVASMLGGATISTVMSSLVGAGTVVLLFWYSPRLALAAVGVVLVVAAFTLVTSWIALRHQRRLEKVEGRLSGLVLQLLAAIPKIRVAGAERRAFARWAEDFASARRLRFQVGRLQGNVTAFNDAMTVVASLVIFAVYVWIARDAAGAVTTGRFIAFTAAFGTFLAAGLDLTGTAVSLLEVIPTLERARPILETRPERDETRPSPGRLTGRVEVSRVTFRYSEDQPPVLEDVSLVAEPGRFVALVGPSGAGKSTLLRLLLGFEIPSSGSVYFDGQDLSSVDPTEVRRQVGVVLQTSRLAAGSVFSNIVGSSSSTLDDAWRAARMAGLEEDLSAMPMGMHTVVSEGGTNLSGGQRQRLLIARALVHRPRILFFDEATSALDNRTQKVVSESLERLNATRIVIAHRLSTIEQADAIYVLRDGRVVQSGTYHDLMSEPGLFADLASRQTT